MPEIVFEKRNGKYDAMLVLENGKWVETMVPKQAPILHDMFHYAVETVVAKRGFFHRRADGEGAGFRMAPEKVSEAVERLVETIQADSWSGRPEPAEVIELFHTTCAARGDEPFAVTAEDIVAIRAVIDDLAARWAKVPAGGRMTLAV
jgi:hypothetical protein